MHNLCCAVVGDTIVIDAVVGAAILEWLSSKQLLSEQPSLEQPSLKTWLSKVCLLKAPLLKALSCRHQRRWCCAVIGGFFVIGAPSQGYSKTMERAIAEPTPEGVLSRHTMIETTATASLMPSGIKPWWGWFFGVVGGVVCTSILLNDFMMELPIMLYTIV